MPVLLLPAIYLEDSLGHTQCSSLPAWKIGSIGQVGFEGCLHAAVGLRGEPQGSSKEIQIFPARSLINSVLYFLSSIGHMPWQGKADNKIK